MFSISITIPISGVICVYIKLKISKVKLCIVIISFMMICFSVLYSGTSINIQPTSTNEEEISLPIIMYHSLMKDSKYQGQFVISPTQLEDDLKALTEKGYTTITVKDLIEYIDNNKPLPQKPIMLTFDDGYYNNYLYAYPLMKQYNCCAVISPIAYYSEKYSETEDKPSASYFHCNWKQLKEMSESGCFEIQNHSYNMHSQSGRLGIRQKLGENKEQYKSIVTKDITKAQNLLKEKVGVLPTAFVYPFGAMNDTSEEIMKNMGFRCTITCEEKVNHIARNRESLYKLGRHIRTNAMTSKQIFDKIDKEINANNV